MQWNTRAHNSLVTLNSLSSKALFKHASRVFTNPCSFTDANNPYSSSPSSIAKQASFITVAKFCSENDSPHDTQSYYKNQNYLYQIQRSGSKFNVMSVMLF